MTPKIGKTAKDIFAPTAKPPVAKPKGSGRPAEHGEPWTKVTVVLFDRQIAYLDRAAADIRLKTRSAVSRAELIRAMIDAVEAGKIDLSIAGSEEASEKLGIGRAAVLALVRRGVLKAKRKAAGKLSWLEIPDREIERFMRERTFGRGPRGVRWTLKRKTK